VLIALIIAELEVDTTESTLPKAKLDIKVTAFAILANNVVLACLIIVEFKYASGVEALLIEFAFKKKLLIAPLI
jgi:hypothetical protein